ncbi:hybrid sensor histidine kinase/response regulator transcription factor [Mucilaginibacter sp. SJ]|uniref:hybrid sensor histidine kinase/response regulator transcription factor n=1 Tax=Mucilaginibacter sp. SJ TaxID=3029053 RepID=UPI0023A99CDE|nr:hybrid sensor histidine kinase/response regulator transcription factor [Mucilaginibacter sp. SJ]WEA00613.1 two-component regulator propeller domain-containing protein [Mucilaginibacter sp. SJ]
MNAVKITGFERSRRISALSLYLIWVLTISSVTGARNASAQSAISLGIEQGLSNNNINAIFKDKTGFIWFGTYNGLNRFDGYVFRKFRNRFGDTTSLPDNEISAITEDPAGKLWVATAKGIAVLDSRTLFFSGIRFQDSSGKNQRLTSYVCEVKVSKTGMVLIGTDDAGLMVCHYSEKVCQQLPILFKGRKNYHYRIRGIIPEENGNALLLIDNIGVWRFVANKKAIQPVCLLAEPLNCFVKEQNGTLWVGTNNGMAVLKAGKKEVEPYKFKNNRLCNTRIFYLVIDRTNKLWVASDGQGLAEIDLHTLKETGYFMNGRVGGLTSNVVRSIFVDDHLRKWVGTIKGGIDVIDKERSQFRTVRHDPGLKNSLPDNAVYSICEDGADIWIGLDGGGLCRWSPKDDTFNTYKHVEGDPGTLSNDIVTAVLKDREGHLWAGTYGGGVNRLNRVDGRFVTIPFQQQDKGLKYVVSLFQDHSGDLFAGCIMGRYPGRLESGLYKLDRSAQIFRPVSGIKPDIFAITEDDNHRLWLGNLTGLICFDPVSGKSKSLNLKAYVRALHRGSNGTIWVGTYGNGLLAFDQQLQLKKSFTEENGLSNNTILNIEEDAKGNIWTSTYDGLSKIDPVSNKIQIYDSADGLQSNQFYYNASATLKSGAMAFGGIKGFSIFQPDSIRTDSPFPNLAITGLRVANGPVDANSEYVRDADNIYDIRKIVLPYDRAILSLDYVALEYSKPEKIQYAYFLQGWDKTWNKVGSQRNINYSRINEGEYILRIKCTNSAGIWNGAEKLIYITVLPPWYRTWWAYLLYVAALSGGIYAYLHFQKRLLKLNYEMEITNIRAGQEKELNERKISFFTNISHEFRTPLTLIANPVKELMQSNGKNLEFIDLSSIYRNTRRLLSMIDQLLLFRTAENEVSEIKAEYFDIIEVCREVFCCFNNQVKFKSISYNFQSDMETLEMLADREKIEIVIFNLISNAIKFTPAGGLVSLLLVKENDQIMIEVADTGKGIPENTGDRLFDKFYKIQRTEDKQEQSGFGIGLFLAKHFVEIHGGTIGYESVPGKSTVFRVRLLLKNEQLLNHLAGAPVYPKNFRNQDEVIRYIEDEPVAAAKVNSNTCLVDQLLDSSSKQKASILLIDDDKEMSAYISRVLRDQYHIFEVQNAEDGLSFVTDREPDLVISDVNLKGMSGVELCTRIKESAALSHLPVILITGSSSPEIKLQGIKCGADDYITKPFEVDILVARIRSILKGRNNLKKYFFNEITLKNNSLKIPEEYSSFLTKCIRVVEEHIDDEDFDAKLFAREMSMSQSNLFRKVKSISGLSISEFVRYIRLRKAAELMITSDIQIKEVPYRVGFQQVRYFREQFHKVFGMNPSDFISRHRTTFQSMEK